MNIDDIFKEEDKTQNEWLSKAFDIIRFRQNNPLKYIRDKKRRPDNYIMCHKHHIIPKSAFRYIGIPVDNSPQNKVVVTIIEHIKIHYFYAKYFQCRQSEHDIFKMLVGSNATAVNITLHVNCMSLEENNLVAIAEETKILESERQSERSKLIWEDPEKRKQILDTMQKNRTAETEARRIAALRDVFTSGKVDTKAIGESSHDRWQDPEYKKRTVAARKKFNAEHPESRINAGKKISETLHRDPSVLANRNKKTGAAIKRAWERMTPEQRKVRSELLKKTMKHYSYEIIDADGNVIKKFDCFDQFLDFFHQQKILNCYGKEIKESALHEAIRRFLIGQIKDVYGFKIRQIKSS